MDVSKNLKKTAVEGIAAEGSTDGNDSELLTEVASLTGLPVDWVQSELTQIVKKSGHTPNELTLDELRASMLEYLEEMNREMTAQEASDLDFLDSLAVPSDLSH
jgi:hypothetical protein